MSDCPNDQIVKRVANELFGNGQEGIVKKFTRMETEHTEVKQDLNKLATSFSALVKTDSNREAVKKMMGKSFVIGCSIIGAAGTIVGILHVIVK